MFSHIMVGANDIQASKKFYDAIFKPFGYEEGAIDELGRCVYVTPTGLFILTTPRNGEKATHGNGYTIGFAAPSPEAIDAWHEAGINTGGKAIENPPGIRQLGETKMYLAYLLDPAGNKICALHR